MQKLEINRRWFLMGLAALGASTTLSTPVEAATPAQVDTAWRELEAKPWFFDVRDRTIVDLDAKAPEVRSDAFEDVSSGHASPDGLIMDVEACPPLASHFMWLAHDKLTEVEEELEDLQPPFEDDDEGSDGEEADDHVDRPPREAPTAAAVARRAALGRLQLALADPDDGWKKWVILEGAEGLPRFDQAIDEWLNEPIDSGDWDYVSLEVGTQGGPYGFFSSMESDILDALGIVVVEGEHPGSTYYAAELRRPIDAANVAAKELGLPFRFR